jgi:hypothetical protein
MALARMLLRWQAQRERIGTVRLVLDVRAEVGDTRAPGGGGAVSGARSHVAASDCEEIRPGLIAQPANALSSLAFVVAAIPIARAARRRRRPAWLAVALAAAVEGVGSVAYHGPGGTAAKRLHDGGLVALTATLGVALAGEGAEVHRRPWTAGLTVAAVTLHALSRTGGPLCSCRSPLQGHAVFHVLAAAALATAAARR